MSRGHVLVVEDDEDIRELIIYNLSREGFRVTAVDNGEDAVKRTRADHFDVIILDVMLPGMDGLDVCKIIKKDEKSTAIPIIMLTAKGEDSDVVMGLELGADDYIVKPFSPKILIARIKNVLRRKQSENIDPEAIVAIHDITIHPGRREVIIGKHTVDLTNLEFRVLHLLASRPGWVFSRYQIVEGVRGDNYPVTDRSVDVLVVGLRKKMGDAGLLIETVRGAGYRFKEEE